MISMKAISNAFSFSMGIALAIGLAFAFPQPGAPGGLLQAEMTAKLAIILIFFLQGLTLPLEDIRAAFGKPQLHGFTQCFIFIVMPLLIIGGVQPLRAWLPNDLWIGFVYLAVLPTTISTSIVYVSTAGGDTVAAVFNTTVANIAGVFIVPSTMAWVAAQSGEAIPLLPLLIKICGLVLLPMLSGQAMRMLWPLTRPWLDRQKKRVKRINTGLVLFIIYCSFCGSVQDGIWSRVDTRTLIAAAGLCLAFFLCAMALSTIIISLLKFKRADAITAFFCSTQKGLAAAVPMAQSIFAGSSIETSMVLLPILLYHGITLSIEGALAGALWQHKATTSTKE